MTRRLLRPDRYCASVLAIDAAELAASGVRAVLLDLDNTLQARDSTCVGSRERAWLGRVQSCGIACCIVSNSGKPRVHEAARSLGLPVVCDAYKPFARGYRRACALLGVSVPDAVMVGDQTYTDILGAHVAGMRAILVKPLCDTDPPHTRALRRLDALVVRGMPIEGVGACTGATGSQEEGT